MALPFSQFPLCPSKITSAESIFSFPTPRLISNSIKRPTIFASKPLRYTAITKASQEEDNNTITSKKFVGADGESQPKKSQNQEITELGMEIKKSVQESEQNEEVGFLSGVGEEIREIEWPSLNKVLGATWVVLGVIAGSSVVLLTINAVLAELSDSVFAGKGIHDFFGW